VRQKPSKIIDEMGHVPVSENVGVAPPKFVRGRSNRMIAARIIAIAAPA